MLFLDYNGLKQYNTKILARVKTLSDKVNQLSNKGNDGVPVGAIFWQSATTAPSGFLICDGSAVNRSLYTNLFAIIGTTFGVGDGSTTFKLPDLRASFIRGSGSQYPYSATFGQKQYATSFYFSDGVYGFPKKTANVPAMFGSDNNQYGTSTPSFINSWDTSGSQSVNEYGWFSTETNTGVKTTLSTKTVRPFNLALTPIIKY